MKKIIFLLAIFVFWFLLGLGLSYLSSDPLLSSTSTLDPDYDITFNESAFNVSTIGTNPTAGGVLDMLIGVFTNRIPTSILPSEAGIFLAFINWLLLITAIILIYRIVNPLA